MDGNKAVYGGTAAVSMKDREAQEPQVVFYQLCSKFVDDDRSIPEDAQEVMYYTLAVGHHTGVIDCFEEKLRCGLPQYERILGLFDTDEVAHYKLAGILRSGEIQIDRSHRASLVGAVNEAVLRAEVQEDASWLASFAQMLTLLGENGAAYIMGRRREP